MSTDLILPFNRVDLKDSSDEDGDFSNTLVDTAHSPAPGPVCPVCTKLPLKELAQSEVELSLSYQYSLDFLSREQLETWAQKCDLAKMVQNLEMYWGGQREQISLSGDGVFAEICERGFRQGSDLRERWLICGTIGEWV